MRIAPAPAPRAIDSRAGLPRPLWIRGAIALALGGSLLLAQLGCSSLRDGTDSFGSVQRGLSSWSCIGQPDPPVPATIPPVHYTTDVVDWVSNGVPPGLEVCLCAQVDVPAAQPDAGVVACSQPLKPCFSPPADNVNVGIDLMPRADTFLAFLTPSTVPDALYFNRPPLTNLVGKPPIRLISFATAASLAASFQLVLQPTLGLIVLRAFDCNGDPAAGVRFTLDPSPSNIIPFAYQNNAPSPLLLSTDATGQFGFGNALPGNALATAYLTNGTDTDTSDDTEIGTVNILVRAGWATLVDFRP